MSVILPFAEDLVLGVPLPRAPEVTIDSGLAAQYLAITGDTLPAALSDHVSARLTGAATRLANPGLVVSVSIGQSTVATRRVIANLQYRNLTLLRPVHVGETLVTRVTPLAADWTRSGRDRAKVLLGMELTTTSGALVANYQRLALLPVADSGRLVAPGLPEVDAPAPLVDFVRCIPTEWVSPPASSALPADEWTDPLADTVSSARELVRLTNNLAATHRDEREGPGGRRLVYGGHTVGLAQASLARMLPDLLTIVAWRSCDHLAPVYEDDLLTFRAHVDAVETVRGFRLVDVTCVATAHRASTEPIDVLEWHPVLALAGGEE